MGKSIDYVLFMNSVKNIIGVDYVSNGSIMVEKFKQDITNYKTLLDFLKKISTYKNTADYNYDIA